MSLNREPRRRVVARRRRDPEGEPGALDETEWEDWRQLRQEIGKRLGGRDATGMSDPEILDAARKAQDARRTRKR